MVDWVNKVDANLKEKIEKYVSEESIEDVDFVQNNIYLFLKNSKTVILKNGNRNFYEEIKTEIERKYYSKKRKKRVSDWNELQIEYLKQNFINDDMLSLSYYLEKSVYQITIKALELELLPARKWSFEELEYLKENMEQSNVNLAVNMRRSLSSIKAKKRILKQRGD